MAVWGIIRTFVDKCRTNRKKKYEKDFDEGDDVRGLRLYGRVVGLGTDSDECRRAVPAVYAKRHVDGLL